MTAIDSIPLPDQPARDAIRSRLDVNMLVEAGAGSGKTENLARRMAEGIASGRCEVEGMAAVTFTRKAAAELRGRFQLALERQLEAERARGAPDADRCRRLDHALRHLERLFAGTIHAFCAHLLRERPVEAGVAPGFAELDEAGDLTLRQRAWREHLDAERRRGSMRYRELLEAGVEVADLDPAFAALCTHDEVEFPTAGGGKPDLERPWAELAAFWAELERLLPRPIPAGTTCKTQLRARDFQRRFTLRAPPRHRSLAEMLAHWQSPPAMTLYQWKHAAPDLAQQRTLRDDLQARLRRLSMETAAPYLAAWRQYVYDVAIELMDGARAHARELRRRAGTLSYTDLLQLAARLLRESRDVREVLQRKYRWLFVDEFQDTDPVQAEVILLLAGEAGPEADWTRIPLRPGALFIVGDPKQSIFRFRRADIDIYTRVRDRILASGGTVEALGASMRSGPGLCRWVNEVFERHFPREARAEQPAWRPLDPVRADDPARLAGVRRLTVPESVGRDEIPRADAEVIARFVEDEIAAGRRQAGDFLVLTRIRANLPLYAQALEARRIPVELSGGAAFAASPRVRALAGLLRALADPDDGAAVVGVLRGPLLGLSDPDLFRHREAGHGFLLLAPRSGEPETEVARSLERLRHLYHVTRRLPAAAAVDHILEETGLLALAGADSAGGAEAGNLLHAVDRVRRMAEEGGTLAAAADALEADVESAEIEAIALEPGRRDVVRVMNLHKAKGLEAAVVFLADPRRGGATGASAHIVRAGERPLGFLVLERRLENNRGSIVLARPADWEAVHLPAEQTYLNAEAHRLQYVAATRARELLVVSTWGGSPTAWPDLAPHLEAAPDLPVPPARPAPAPALPDLGAAARAAASASSAGRLGAMQAPSWQVDSVTATAHRAAIPGHPPPEGRIREPDTGMQWGTLIHALLEHAMRHPGCDRAQLGRLAAWLTLDDADLRRVVPEALDTVERVRASDLWREAVAAGERQVEVPFGTRVAPAPGGAPGRLLYGTVDLAFRTAAGWTIADYKTDQVPAGDIAIRYRDQVRLYTESWRRLTGQPVSRSGILAIRSGGVWEPVES